MSLSVRIGHLYPDYLNIYADRGNMAVFARRAAARGLELEVSAIGLGEPVRPGTHDLYYVGGGQDREQALIAADLAEKGEWLREAVAGGAAALAVCGGYQLFGRFYRDRYGGDLRAPACSAGDLRRRAADDRRRPARVLLHRRAADARRVREPRRAHGPRPGRRAARTRGRGLRKRRPERLRGLPRRPRGRHIPARAAAPPNPWLADWLLAQAVAHQTGGEPPVFEPLDDELESAAHAVSAARAKARGGRF